MRSCTFINTSVNRPGIQGPTRSYLYKRRGRRSRGRLNTRAPHWEMCSWQTVSVWLLFLYLYFCFPSFIHMSPSSERLFFYKPFQSLGGKELLICKLSDLYKDRGACFPTPHLRPCVDMHVHTQTHYAVDPPL